MEDKTRERSDYNWRFSGEDIRQLQEKYTQGFDPEYLRHAEERKRQQAQAEKIEKSKKGKKRPASGRQKRLTHQQQIVTAVEETPPEEQIVQLETDRAIYAEEKVQRKARASRRRGYRARRLRRQRTLRIVSLAVLGFAALMLGLLIANRYQLTITMAGEDPLYVDFGKVFTDPGATAEYRGSIFHTRDREVAVTSINDVDTGKYGTYQIKYHASYKKQETDVTRTVLIRDTTAPTITLDAAANVVMNGQTWTDAFTATDDQDGDITEKVQVSGSVDTSRNGTYTLSYRVADASGNTAEASREVIVSSYRINNPGLAEEDGSNVVYLTFDDGPGPYTEELLEILNRFNVQATFFVTDQEPGYRALIKEEFEKGHTIGNHTASHDYEMIYSTPEAFWEDYEAMDAVIESETGEKPAIFRFPGGSSNTASEDTDIMTNLTKQATGRHLQYYDWTVVSGDSVAGYSEESIYNAIVYTLDAEERPECIMVLCHDLVEETVLAIRDVIPWALEHGYVFLPITEETPIIHHSVQY